MNLKLLKFLFEHLALYNTLSRYCRDIHAIMTWMDLCVMVWLVVRDLGNLWKLPSFVEGKAHVYLLVGSFGHGWSIWQKNMTFRMDFMSKVRLPNVKRNHITTLISSCVITFRSIFWKNDIFLLEIEGWLVKNIYIKTF